MNDSSDKPMPFSCAILLLIATVLFFCVAGPFLVQPEEATRILSSQGYTEIEITGWRPLMGSDSDTYSTGFKAKSPSGQIVTGAVTSGVFFKGHTVRLD
jgi:hypothetical protein